MARFSFPTVGSSLLSLGALLSLGSIASIASLGALGCGSGADDDGDGADGGDDTLAIGGDDSNPTRDGGTSGDTGTGTETSVGADGGIADTAAPTDGTPPPPPPGCPAAPAGISAAGLDAYAAVNAARTAAGAPCAAIVAALDDSATKHCEYYSANVKIATCIANPHVEVSTCASYYSANFNEREKKAGYAGSPASEDMHFIGNPKGAVQGWLDTIYHRYPILDPWTRDFGYGNTSGCDTMDFGGGAATAADVVAVYPFDGQTGVPTSFGGAETPKPPAPPKGWPSGYPISVHVKGTITTATLTKFGSATPITLITVPKLSFQANAQFYYAEGPLEAGTKYQMHVVGNNGKAFTKDWVFTTR